MDVRAANPGDEARRSTDPLSRLLSNTPVFAAMQDAVLAAGIDGRIVFVNDAATRIFEVPAEELRRPLSEYPTKFHLRMRARVPTVPLAERALRGEIVEAVERLIRTPSGVEKVLRTSAAPLRDDEGTIVGAVVLVADVSAEKVEEERAREHAARLRQANEERARALAEAEHALLERRRAEEELHASEQRFAIMFRRSPLAKVWVRLPARTLADVNEAWVELTGIPREEAIGRTAAELGIVEADAEDHRRFYGALQDAGIAEGDLRLATRRDGARVVHIRAERIQFRGESFVLGALQDVTERKRAERALRESEQRFRMLTEAMPQIVCILGADGLPEYVNARWVDFSGLDLAASRRAGWPGVLHPEDLPAAAACRRRALKTLAPQEVELRYRAADGTFRWFLSRLAPVVEDGRVVRLVGAAMDIEDRKRVEEALRDTDRRRTEFLGVLSHELRNPLAPIRNAIYLLEKLPPGSPQAARAREVVKRQTEHLTRLVDDLLDVTRISRGKVQLRREVVDLRELVRRTCEDHRSMFVDAELELSVDLPNVPVPAEVDPTRVAQVIGNLLANANKFTPPGGAVTVRLRPGAGRAEITIRDTGAGISPEHVARMFEPFAQEDRSLARTRGGLGLGLALSKGLVELHGGTISARSEGPGKGSEFTIALPAVEAAPEEPARPPEEVRAGVRRRVLVIEDNADAARTLAEVLELAGHEVTVARTGEAGVSLARALRPDFVICDLGLPDLDGFEVGRTLRADRSLRSTRLIALSGYAQPEDVERAREAGFESHLPKPAPLERLAEMLR